MRMSSSSRASAELAPSCGVAARRETSVALHDAQAQTQSLWRRRMGRLARARGAAHARSMDETVIVTTFSEDGTLHLRDATGS
jgi:hypothetical protein